MLCASNPGKDSCQGESGGDDDHEEKKDKRQRRGKYDGNNRYRYIDLQQVYLLQSEALKYKTLMFICEYFRHHGRIKH